MVKKDGSIGVFDSGIGGLTVLKALQERYPHESYVYIGDTARLPYGTKSPETIIRYSEGLTRIILMHDVKAIIVACNTASTHALPAVQKLAGDIPVLGMIKPAAKEAITKTRNNHIGVIATFGTINSGIYEKTIKSINPAIKVSSQACQLLVAIAEEGWADTIIAEDTLRKYLEPMFDHRDKPDTLILGCTHFPLFEKHITKILGPDIILVNSGKAAAENLQLDNFSSKPGVTRFFATDDPARFAVSAEKFFGKPISEKDVALIDL